MFDMSQVHQTNIRVRGYHLDVFQHVNNARYLEFLEEARWQYFEETGLTPLFFDHGYGMAVININIHYRRSAGFNDDLTISSWFSRIYPRKAEVTQVIRQKATGQVVVEATVTFVAFDQHTKKAVSFNAALKQRLHELECQF
ncbi:thioesterase family protein [Neisseriaceae bacterium ESL0693]|nr:thioesterase family protein [Neisseriaceae bacterium ESL0693]